MNFKERICDKEECFWYCKTGGKSGILFEPKRKHERIVMKEERMHKLLLRVAIVTFAMGVIISVIVTSIVMGIIYRGEIQGQEVGSEPPLVSPNNEVRTSDANAQDATDNESFTNAGEGGAYVEMIPEILAGGIVTPLTENDEERWYLKLVNHNHAVAPDHSVELAEISAGIFVDSRIQADVLALLESASNHGMDLVIVSAYRSYEDQVEIFNNMMYIWISGGHTPLDAFLATQSVVAVPGHSEHHLGLALDIVSAHHQVLDESQSQTLEGRWLRENSWRYGFVVRYLEDKTHITGIFYEPWHFRYVGREAARIMWENNLVLEEYLVERYFLRN